MDDEELEEIRREKMRRLLESMKEKQIAEPIEVTDKNFDEFIGRHENVVIDCWAPWCGPCRAFGPVLERVAKDYAGKIVFGKLNVDENPYTAERFGITGIPTVLAFKNGKLLQTLVGAMGYELFRQKISQIYGV